MSAMRTQDVALGFTALLGGSGALHLVRPRIYDWLVPPELGPARPWVTGSGVAELGTAALLAVPATRRAGGWAAARLPLQVPMVLAALRVARGR